VRTFQIVLFASLLSTSVLAQAENSVLRFDVVSVKADTSGDLTIRSEPALPDGYRRNLPVESHLRYAFDIAQLSRLVNLPDWALTTRYEIAGKATEPITDQQRRAMVRDVLATRFGLRTHVEQRELPVYILTTDRSDKRLGTGLRPRPDCASDPCERGGTGTPQGVKIRATTLTQFADGMLSNLLRQVVRDETGVGGVFDVEASWRPSAGDADAADNRPDMFTAFREQLGLRLEPSRRPVDVLVIDHIERPTEN
jgi:uncharacterized protein (TIGR03435 family)